MSATQRELRLEFQSDRIEMVLASHKAPARVMGGVVTPRAVQFHLAPMLGTKINRVQALADELALALGVSSVRVSRQGSSVQLEIPRDDTCTCGRCKCARFSIKLLSLMPRLVEPDAKPLPPGIVPFKGIAVLGLCDDGAPLLLRLPSPDVAHVLIAGTTGSDKTALCQTMILSLAMTHRRSQLQFVLAEGPKQHAFKPFARLPHLLRPVIGDATEAVDALRELARLMEARRVPVTPRAPLMGEGTLGVAQGETPALAAGASVTPRILVVLDELADLTVGANAGGKALNEHLTRLVQRGREAGIHVMAYAKAIVSGDGDAHPGQFPGEVGGQGCLAGRLPLKGILGIACARGSRYRRNRGRKACRSRRLVAIAAGQVIRFQAAYVSAAEMDQVVAQMGSTLRRRDVVGGRPSLLHQAVALVAGAG